MGIKEGAEMSRGTNKEKVARVVQLTPTMPPSNIITCNIAQEQATDNQSSVEWNSLHDAMHVFYHELGRRDAMLTGGHVHDLQEQMHTALP